MKSNVITRNINLYGSLSVMICVYLYQIYSQQLSDKFELNNYIEIVFISILCGIFTYLLLFVLFYIVTKYQEKEINQPELIQYTFYAGEAERNFDEITDSIHKIIVDGVEIPQFDSELVDDMGSKVACMWKVTCMAYAYGLLSIYCIEKNSQFMRSDEKIYFQDVVIKRVANYRKKLAFDFEDEHVTNQELSSSVSEMIADVTEIVSINFRKSTIDKDKTLDGLIDHLMNNINVKVPDLSTRIKSHSEKVLNDWMNENSIYV